MNEQEFKEKLKNLFNSKRNFPELFLEKNEKELSMLMEWYQSIIDLFKSLNEQKKLIIHPRHSGDEAENIFISHLLKLIPDRFGIGKGFVINPRFDISSEQDCILYDKSTAAKLMVTSTVNYLPFQSVMGSIEVKSTLTKAELRKAILNAISLKKIYYYDFNDVNIGDFTYNSEPSFNNYKTLYSIFAYDSNLTLEELCNELNSIYNDIPNKYLKIDCIYVLGKGLIIPMNEGFGITFRDIIASNNKFISYSTAEEAISFLRFITLYIDHCIIEANKRISAPLYEEFLFKPMLFKNFKDFIFNKEHKD